MKIVFSLIFVTFLLFSQTINEQIHALEKASPEKRVELMNSIKKQLISMNEEKRMETIGDLQEKLKVKANQRSFKNPYPLKNRHELINDLWLEQHGIHEQRVNSSFGESFNKSLNIKKTNTFLIYYL